MRNEKKVKQREIAGEPKSSKQKPTLEWRTVGQLEIGKSCEHNFKEGSREERRGEIGRTSVLFKGFANKTVQPVPTAWLAWSWVIVIEQS